MSYIVVDKHYNSILNDYWYRIDVNNNDIKNWISKQPSRLWYHIEFTNFVNSYSINEELYTLIQLTWGDQ